MADILIKGIKMPKSCIDPKTLHGCFCLLHCKVGRQSVADGKSLDGRPSDCPLVEVKENLLVNDHKYKASVYVEVQHEHVEDTD